METKEILKADEQAYINAEKLWAFVSDNEDVESEELSFAKSLYKMYKAILKDDVATQVSLKCEKGYKLFNKLYEKYVTETDCDEDEIASAQNISAPSEEIYNLVGQFVSSNDIIDKIDSQLDNEENVDFANVSIIRQVRAEFQSNTLSPLVNKNEIRKDARELGLNSDDLAAAAEMIANR